MLQTLVALVAASGVPVSPPQAAQSFSRKVSVTVSGRYQLSLPEGYESGRERYPLLLFLHGAGERGDDLERAGIHGPLKEIRKGRKLPFIVVAPLCPSDMAWDPLMLSGLLDEVESKWRVDKDREYVTGLSLGGFGTYTLASFSPKRFAAIAPIAGWASRWIASTIKEIPIWSTHGDADPAVPLDQEAPLIAALKEAGADVRFDVIAGGTHDVWSDVYAGDALYAWLLEHRRKR
ncbi:MAG: alpha/beta hydrolase-fold protein [Fimbriimonadaceae bacterium]|nr:dienelactone hydrolase family protein [Chthonomonadaceae bacterium]MCO5297285.1 alpha/beta hydrolase-fold protein [Fimbriimonadaceae bacterium]